MSKYPTQIPSKDKDKVPFDYESYEERGDEEGDGELVGEGDAEAEDDDKRNEGPGNSSRIEREIKGILVKKMCNSRRRRLFNKFQRQDGTMTVYISNIEVFIFFKSWKNIQHKRKNPYSRGKILFIAKGSNCHTIFHKSRTQLPSGVHFYIRFRH